MDCNTPGFHGHHKHLELAQTHVHRVSDAIQPSHPLLFPSPPAFNLTQHQGLFNEPVLHISWPKYWSFSINISLSDEYLGLIYFRIDWFDLLVVQRLSRVQKYQFFSAQPSLESNSHIHK